MCGDDPAEHELDTQENGISDSLGHYRKTRHKSVPEAALPQANIES